MNGLAVGQPGISKKDNYGLSADSTLFPKTTHMSRSRWWVWGCPWSQHLLIRHFSLLFISPNTPLEQDDVRRTAYFNVKIPGGKSQGFTWLLESEMGGKKGKQNHPVFHKSLISHAPRAKVEKGLKGNPLSKSLFAAPVCTYQKLHEQYLQYFFLRPQYLGKMSVWNNFISRTKIHHEQTKVFKILPGSWQRGCKNQWSQCEKIS